MAEEIRDEEKGKRLLSYGTTLFLRLIIVALLMAPAMLVVPPLSVAPMIVSILLLFAVAYVLEDKLKKNENERAISQINDRFGDVIIGIISGLVASYLTYLALTLAEISIPLLFFIVPMVFAVMTVGFSLVVVWVFFTTQKSR